MIVDHNGTRLANSTNLFTQRVSTAGLYRRVAEFTTEKFGYSLEIDGSHKHHLNT
jgi:hypothetical protein